MNDGSNVKHGMPSMPDDTECLIDMSLDKHTSKMTEDYIRRQSCEENKSRSRSREKPGRRLKPDRCLADIDCMQPLSISIKADDRLACIPEKELRYVDVDEHTFIQSGYQHMAICCKQEYADKQPRVYSLENDLMISGIIVNFKFYDKFGVWALVYEETYSKRLRLKFFRPNDLKSGNGIMYEDYLSCKMINAYSHVFLCSSERGIQGFDLNTINNMFHESLQLKLISTSASIFISNDIADFCISGQHLYTIDKACKTVSRVNMSFKSRNPLSNHNSSKLSKSVKHRYMSAKNTTTAGIYQSDKLICIYSDTKLTFINSKLQIMSFLNISVSHLCRMTGSMTPMLMADGSVDFMCVLHGDAYVIDGVKLPKVEENEHGGTYDGIMMISNKDMIVYGTKCYRLQMDY